MLNTLDIALMCDNRSLDADGNAVTPDRSRHGIHAQLGDGVTAGTMPTLDALNGRFTFDGGDYMVLSQANDVDDVLANMGSIQDETYLFYIDPLAHIADPNIPNLFSTDNGVNPRFYLRLDGRTANRRFEMVFINAGAVVEYHTSPVGSLSDLYGKSFVLAHVRQPALAAERSKIFVNSVLISTDNDACVDASSAKNPHIGSNLTPGAFLTAGTGLRFFGYSRTAWTATQLRALQRYLRGVI